jgi:16S rRNA (guanine(527)-N(7))-methyltransferase RsmG
VTHAELVAAGCEVDAAAHARLAQFVDVLLAENRVHNLTAIRTPEAVWPLHILDSLALLPRLDARAATPRVADLGSGGGVPGIPLAIARPALRVTLFDATRKKVDACNRMIEALKLDNVRAVWARVEARGRPTSSPKLPVGHAGRYDVVLARAVGPLAELVERAATLLSRDAAAECWFHKSVAALPAELEAAEAAAQRVGLRHVETLSYSLPAEHGPRAIAVFGRRGGRLKVEG